MYNYDYERLDLKMSDKKTLKRLIALFFIFTLLASYGTFAVSANSEAAPAAVADGVASVALNSGGNKLSVTITLSDDFLASHKKQTLHLFELPLGMDERDLSKLSPVMSFRATSKYVYKTALYEGNISRLYSAYVLAIENGSGYTPIGAPRYVGNASSASQYSYEYPDAVSPKGLEVTSVSDALSLGLSHAVIPVSVEKLFGAPDADSISYDFLGVTYHFDRSAVGSLDDKISALSRENIRVYLRFLLTAAPSELPASLSELGYADAPAAKSYAMRADSTANAPLFGALFSFIAERYTDPVGTHGFCGSFIIGSEVNVPTGNYSTSPELSADRHIEVYSKLVRIAHTAMRSFYENGRVYIATSNNFSIVPSELSASDVSMTEFFSAFDSKTRAGGDFDWSIATAAYAYSRTDSGIWDDALATGASSQLISPANINVLSYALSKSYTYEGNPRRLMIGAFAVPSSPTDNVAHSSENDQAASYAFAYYKMLEDGTVDAFIYANQFDSPESTDNFGLSRTDMSGNVLSRKKIWSVLREIDTGVTPQISSLASSIGGVLEYMVTSGSVDTSAKNILSGTSQALSSLESYKLDSIFDFSTGLRHEFVSAGRGYTAPPRLISTKNGSALLLDSGTEFRTVRYNVKRSTIRSGNLLIIDLASTADSGVITLRLSQGDALMYESAVNIHSDCTAVSFDITEFNKLASGKDVTISISLSSATGEVSISHVSAAELKIATPAALWIIIIIIVTLVVLLAAIALFTRFYHRHRRYASRKAVQSQREE